MSDKPSNLGPGYTEKIVQLPLQKVGEVCKSCEKFHKDNKKEPMILVRLGGNTEGKHAVVPVCPYCDGEWVTSNTPGKEPEPVE